MTVKLNFVSSGEDERILGSTVKIFLFQIADRVHRWLTPIGGLGKCLKNNKMTTLGTHKK
jgi:hypothetical protein